MGVTLDVNDIFHKATMEMAQNDMHLLQAMWQNNVPLFVYYVSHLGGFETTFLIKIKIKIKGILLGP
jgi:hypothetical protein